jgi:hypothetical protein
MKRYHIWHNTRGQADEYFIVNNETHEVVPQWFNCIWSIPRFIGRLICKD